LGISDEQVEEIVVSLILDDKIQGRIDQVTGRLDLDKQCVGFLPPAPSCSLHSASVPVAQREPSTHMSSCPARSTAVETRRYQALDRWTSQLTTLHSQLIAKASSVGQDRNGPPGAAPWSTAGGEIEAWA